MMMYIRSFIFSVGMILATVIHATLSLFTYPFPLRWRYRFITLWSRFIVFWLRLCCGIRYKIQNQEVLQPLLAQKKGVVVLSKHQSTWETLAFQVIFPPQTWVLKRELLQVPFFGWALSLLDPIAINRKARLSAIDQLISEGKKRLDQGRWVIVFPEGTRMARGQTNRFAKGGAALAKQCDCWVLPVAHNSGTFWPRRGFLKHSGTIQIVLGQPIDPKHYDVQQINQIAKEWIDATTASLEKDHAK